MLNDNNVIVEYVKTDSANRIKRGDGRLYHISLYLLAWITVLVCSWMVKYHFVIIISIRKPFSVVLETLCVIALVLMALSLLCFNKMDHRWYLYSALIAASINLVYTANVLCLAYGEKQTLTVIVLYTCATFFVSCFVIRKTISKMKKGECKSGNVIPIGLAFGSIGAGIGILLGELISTSIFPFLAMILSLILVHIATMFATIYWRVRKCNISKGMWFNEKYATINDSETDF